VLNVPVMEGYDRQVIVFTDGLFTLKVLFVCLF
jgi:hypothetical protein